MACTATATRSVCNAVMKTLEMWDCVQVSISPDRPNIFYQVQCRTDLEKDLSGVLASLREQSKNAPRAIIYCKSLNACSQLFAYFQYELGDASYFPPGAQQVSDNRFVTVICVLSCAFLSPSQTLPTFPTLS